MAVRFLALRAGRSLTPGDSWYSFLGHGFQNKIAFKKETKSSVDLNALNHFFYSLMHYSIAKRLLSI
jgi:hypothetical protein